MRKRIFIFVTAMLILFFMQLSLVGSLFDKSEYAARRSKFMEKIPEGVFS